MMLRVLPILLLVAAPAAAADPLTGEQIYVKQCAKCHGAAGEGTKKHSVPLVGDKSVPQLAAVIAKTMPEDNVGACVGDDAKKVAAYMHEKFYSPAAQARNKPPRQELSRLTVNQYRNVVADVVGSFRGQNGPWGDVRGLKGQYFKGRNFDGKQLAVERTDPVVAFDFKEAAPVPDKMEADQFSIRWTGSLLATETGMHEFIVQSDQGVRLWVNNNRTPLVDAWVKSGSDTEFRGSLFLLAGRMVTVRLEFTKSKQGVDMKDKKPKPKPAFVNLAWKPPHGVVEPIPARHLAPPQKSEMFAPETPFPPDDRSFGWERGTTISKAWDQATTDAAIETATYVSSRLNELAGTKDGEKDRDAKLKSFVARFAERAFRRPLTPEVKTAYVDRVFESSPDPETGVRRAILMILKSPRFLYREVGGGPDGYDVAARLAFALWDSIPDADLLKAAAANQLATKDQVAKQAERMLKDERAKAKLRGFLLTWTKADHPPDMAKDPKKYPGFTPEIAADLRASLGLALDDAIWAGDGDFRKLFQGDEVYVNGRLAAFYGTKLDANAPFEKVKLDADKRAGVLTHPYLMAAFAYNGATSPIHRGVFLARSVLGINLRPPQEAFSPLAENLHPTLTTRERVALQTKATACAGCHSLINPLGFTLENFDAVGRYRDADNKKKVDATGGYQTKAGDSVKFNGPKELAGFLTGSPDVQSAFAEALFHYLVQQPVRAYGVNRPQELQAAFAAGGFSIRKLAVEIATIAAITPRDEPPRTK